MTMLNKETKNRCPKLLLLQYLCSHVTCNVNFWQSISSTHDHHLKSFLSGFPESQWKNVWFRDGTFSTIYLGAKGLPARLILSHMGQNSPSRTKHFGCSQRY
uniref:Uncharacterized protein n=1 Tax=Micrurus lemniscatus lemniscatus TaxID=129467 RepID=A0A2D4JEG6_MICLE